MSLEDEMKNEIKRLGNELFFIDQKLMKMKTEAEELIPKREKFLQDLRILKLSLGEEVEEKESQTNLIRLLKEEKK